MMAKRLKKERSTPLTGRSARRVRAAALFVKDMKARRAAGHDGTTVVMVYFTPDDKAGDPCLSFEQEVFSAEEWTAWSKSRRKDGRLAMSKRGKLRCHLGNTNDDRDFRLLPRHIDALLSMVGDII